MQREKKTEIITLRVTPRTKDRIRTKAQELGLTVTDYGKYQTTGRPQVQDHRQ